VLICWRREKRANGERAQAEGWLHGGIIYPNITLCTTNNLMDRCVVHSVVRLEQIPPAYSDPGRGAGLSVGCGLRIADCGWIGGRVWMMPYVATGWCASILRAVLQPYLTILPSVSQAAARCAVWEHARILPRIPLAETLTASRPTREVSGTPDTGRDVAIVCSEASTHRGDPSAPQATDAVRYGSAGKGGGSDAQDSVPRPRAEAAAKVGQEFGIGDVRSWP